MAVFSFCAIEAVFCSLCLMNLCGKPQNLQGSCSGVFDEVMEKSWIVLDAWPLLCFTVFEMAAVDYVPGIEHFS